MISILFSPRRGDGPPLERACLDRYAPGRIADWYFPSPKGGRYDVDNFRRDLRVVNQEAGLPWACLIYRHTFGSQLAMKGESLYKNATLMGNSPEICRRHYTALMPEALTTTVEFSAQVLRTTLLPFRNAVCIMLSADAKGNTLWTSRLTPKHFRSYGMRPPCSPTPAFTSSPAPGPQYNLVLLASTDIPRLPPPSAQAHSPPSILPSPARQPLPPSQMQLS
jgi:hypothetical protein